MFKCEICGKITKPGDKQHKKVIETRKKIYHNPDKYGHDIISEGDEIVKEISVCEKCYLEEDKLNG